MEIKHLEYFVAIAETNSMHRAAERLHVSQQNISRVLKQLEDELGLSLVVRSASGCSLTVDGQEIYTDCLEIINRVNRLKNREAALNCVNEKIKGSLQIYCANGLNDIFEQYFTVFQRHYPSVKVTLSEYAAKDIIQLLKKDQKKIAFIQVSVDVLQKEAAELKKNYQCFLLNKEPLKVVMHKDNPYAMQSSISLKKLSTLPLVVNSVSLDNMPNHVQALLDKGISLNIAYCSNSQFSLINYLKRNVAFSLSTKSNRTFEDSLVTVPIKERIYMGNCFLIAKKSFSPCCSAFLDTFLANMPKNAKKIFKITLKSARK